MQYQGLYSDTRVIQYPQTATPPHFTRSDINFIKSSNKYSLSFIQRAHAQFEACNGYEECAVLQSAILMHQPMRQNMSIGEPLQWPFGNGSRYSFEEGSFDTVEQCEAKHLITKNDKLDELDDLAVVAAMLCLGFTSVNIYLGGACGLLMKNAYDKDTRRITEEHDLAVLGCD